jgi:hypothetical protein
MDEMSRVLMHEITIHPGSTQVITDRRDLMLGTTNCRDLIVETMIHRDLRVTIMGVEVRWHTQSTTDDINIYNPPCLHREISMKQIELDGKFITNKD